MAMRGIFTELSKLEPTLRHIFKLEDGHRILILEYLLEGKEDDPDTFIDLMTQLGGDTMPSIAEQLERRGEQRGIMLGRQEGRQQGITLGREQEARATLRSLLRKKFKHILPDIEKKIDQASYEELQRYLENILDAKSPAETVEMRAQ
ncbi:hypothetical protein [Chrysiogenes arsenatis]|uniref:hypothetical protein n=1 Tax=Chrysiogenes arsenatis TaxID=309797 RepID=UPI00041E4F9B|nr:hypothetical protein [Chrysiogenes arsenatis]